MKKLFLLLSIVLLSAISYAQTTSGYFAERTKGMFNNKGGYIYGVTAIQHPTDTSGAVYSRPFGESASLPRNAFMNSKIYVGIQIDTAFADVTSYVTLQLSGDGTNWCDYDTLDTDCTPNVTGAQWYLADFTDVYAPYARLVFNQNAQAVVIDGDIRFMYAIPLKP